MDCVTQCENSLMMGCGYEGTNANYCIYLRVILNIFKLQNYGFLQNIRTMGGS